MCTSVHLCLLCAYGCGSAHEKPFEVPHSLYAPLPHVSSLFEDHVAMIIKGALFRLQTYGMNMDMI